jgi:hypothetical protein
MSSVLLPKKKCNQDLSKEEHAAKKKLKKFFQLQKRRHKLQVRLRTATEHRNEALVEQTRRELSQLDRTIEEEEEQSDDLLKEFNSLSENEQRARDWVLVIYRQLQSRLDSIHTNQSPATKEVWTEQARVLLTNMTLGTVEVSMMDNEAALRGYTRHKFFERAMLVVQSLAKLTSTVGPFEDVWCHRLQSVYTICSVGCGPGGDAVGVLAFLETFFSNHHQQQQQQQQQRRRLVLFDWAMPQWSSLVLNPLQEILLAHASTSVNLVECDIRTSLWTDPIHKEARRHLFMEDQINKNDEPRSTSNDDGPRFNSSATNVVDLFVISYVLSETRGQWHFFLDDVVASSHPGTMFLLTDPTAWQLHLFRERYEEKIEWQWLDSSMHRPELQPLEGRVGPASVVGIKQ